MKMMTLTTCALVAFSAFAQEQEKDNVKENASNPAVQEVLSQPDGVSLVRNESDGSLQIFSRGTASYDFGDARDIRSKTKAAELRAKAALAKFFNEVVKVEESSASGEGRLSKAVLTQTDEGEVVKKTVTRENIEAVKETLTVRSAAILSTEARNMITDSINARRTIGEKTNKQNSVNTKQKNSPSGAINQNKPEVRTNNTLF